MKMNLLNYSLDSYKTFEKWRRIKLFYKDNGSWKLRQVTMIKYGVVNIKYDGIIQHIYKSTLIVEMDLLNFKLDVEEFILKW